jgi:hypothetical protein
MTGDPVRRSVGEIHRDPSQAPITALYRPVQYSPTRGS